MRSDTAGGVSTEAIVALGLLATASVGIAVGIQHLDGGESGQGVEPARAGGPSTGEMQRYDARVHSTATMWVNGTFNQAEAVVGEANAADETRIPLDDKLQAGVPVRVTVNLTYASSATPSQSTPPDLFLETNSISSPTSVTAESQTPGRLRLVGYVIPFGGSASVVIDADPDPNAPRTEYTLKTQIEPGPTQIPGRAPVAVDIPERAAHLEVQSVDGEASVHALVWRPSGEVVHAVADTPSHRTEIAVDETGEYVVAANETVQVRLLAEDGTPLPGEERMEALERTVLEASAHDLPATGGSETWSLELGKAPLGYAFRFVPAGTQGTGLLAGADMSVEIATEKGVVVNEPLFAPAYHFADGTPPWGEDLTFPLVWTHENAKAGAHEITVSYDGAQDVAMIPGWVGFER